ncbi:DEAD/DEAH box helicase [Aquihabitans sp. McL0605]|uniref:DEAD/DEAH box helicase n=1 Tax=Aquihabitans sp. McL0605 TaxID=3415671 RepID=UPI003CEAE809
MGGHGDDERLQREATTASILRALSTLAVDRRKVGYDVSGSGPTAMAWLGALPSNADDGDPTRLGAVGTGAAAVSSPDLQGLQRYDALTPDSADLRLGWLWMVGTALIEGQRQRVVLPLLSRPVRIHQLPAITKKADATCTIEPITAWDLWPLIEDPDVASQLEAEATFGGGALDATTPQALLDRLPMLRYWVDHVVAASGLPKIRQILIPTDPRSVTSTDLVAIAGYGVYADVGADPSRPKETLANWSTNPAAAGSAFASLYLGPAPDQATDDGTAPGSTPIASPFPLTDRQSDVIHRAGRDPITVLSGPPGTGKSQTAVAAALHAIGKGQSVLVATQSPMAADVLAELLDRVPGPTPVLFGGGERAGTLAEKLADGIGAPTTADPAHRDTAAAATVGTLTTAIDADLDALAADAAWRTLCTTLPARLDDAPLLLDVDATVRPADADALLERCRQVRGVFASWRLRRAERALRTLVGAPSTTSLDDLAHAVELARVRERARRAAPGDRTQADQRWATLVDAERVHRTALAKDLAQDLAERPDGDARRAVAALATALRSGRAARHSHLAAIDVHQLTKALPLWVGTLGDIEHLLPATAAAFDLVILDESSQIDQLAASAALLRAERALVIGDPRQLRFVSFLSDGQVRAALRTEGISELHDRPDLRRVSAFDLAASSSPVAFLDEHFRCVPHLIGFSAQRFYDGRLTVATRHPRNEHLLAIDVHRIDGERTKGVNQAEVTHAVDLVAELLASTTGSIGVVSPYRPQVDALRRAVGERIPIEQLQTGRVRVATVHGMQGAECDVVIASFNTSEAGRSRAFLEDPNLFNVLITRARQRFVVLVAHDAPHQGLLADYLRWADHEPEQPPDAGPADPWTAAVAGVLHDQGTTVRAGYRVGRWTIDLVVGDRADAVAVATRVHPDGPQAHIERHLALDLASWRQAEAFPATFDGDAVATAMAITDLLPVHPAN